MTLIKSISGIRGTIGGKPGDALTPLDAVKFSSAYGTWLIKRNAGGKVKVVIGRDARLSGKMISNIVSSTLNGLGIDVVDLDLSTTPTVEVAVPLPEVTEQTWPAGSFITTTLYGLLCSISVVKLNAPSMERSRTSVLFSCS